MRETEHLTDGRDGTESAHAPSSAPPATSREDDHPPIPALVSDLRAHRGALQKQTEEIARLHDEVVAAAARESRDIIAGAARDVRRILLNARRDLLVLAAQVQEVTGRRIQDLDSTDSPALTGDIARHVRGEARSEIEALQAEAAALRASLGHRATPEPQPAEPLAAPSADAAEEVVSDEEPAVPLQTFHSGARPGALLARSAVFVAAFAAIGVLVVAASLWVGRDRTAINVPAASRARTTPPRAPAVTPPEASVSRVVTSPPWLAFETRRTVWLRILVDDQEDRGALVEAGTRREIPSGERVSVRAGDAGAVMISENGGEPTPLGRDGQVLTRTFVARAQAPPAQASPAQASPAPAPERSPAVNVPAPSRPAAVAAQPAAAPTPSTGSTPPSRSAPAATEKEAPPSADVAIAQAAERWLSAYFAQDTATMQAAAGGTATVSDERAPGKRPRPDRPVRRVLEQVKVLVVGNDAVYTAQLRESEQAVEMPQTYTSLLSAVWERTLPGTWRLISVQLTASDGS